MTDIVERLREQYAERFKNEQPAEVIWGYQQERLEAANEIERLREKANSLWVNPDRLMEAMDRLMEATDEIEQLRAALRDMLEPIGPRDEGDIERFMRDGDEAIKRARAVLEKERMSKG